MFFVRLLKSNKAKRFCRYSPLHRLRHVKPPGLKSLVTLAVPLTLPGTSSSHGVISSSVGVISSNISSNQKVIYSNKEWFHPTFPPTKKWFTPTFHPPKEWFTPRTRSTFKKKWCYSSRGVNVYVEYVDNTGWRSLGSDGFSSFLAQQEFENLCSPPIPIKNG